MAEEKSGETGTTQQALALVSRGRAHLQALPARRRKGLLGGAILLAGVIAGAGWYANRPDWRVLFSGLETRDVQSVSQELGAAGLLFQVTPDGSTVEVPADLLDKARMEVAAKGMPQTGRLGFELFDKPNWVGSEFDEKVNYQRALEGELEHTIGSLGLVRSARVHLVLPQSSLFTQEEKRGKASVVLKLKRQDLEAEQIESIRRLVAGAVENLSLADVTLVDADGRQDLQPRTGKAHEREAGAAMENKLTAMLEPLAGVGNVRAIVTANYDESVEDRTDETYDPAQTATLSMQKTDGTSSPGSSRAQGVPGTASNSPAAAPVGAVQGSAQAAAPGTPPLLQASSKESLPVYPTAGAGQTQTTHEESGTYAVSKHTVHREESPGRLLRVTAAVVINDRRTLEGVGKMEHAVWKPRSSEEMHRLEQLAQAAVAFDGKRGDVVVLENVSFTSNVPEVELAGVDKALEQGHELLRTQPALPRVAMIGLLGMVLVFTVLRPLSRQVMATLREVKTLGNPAAKGSLGGASAEALEAGVETRGGLSALASAKRSADAQMVITQVSDHIRTKPVQSTRLLESWIEGKEN